jgi:CheY-specific phosphatase CheX
MSMSTKEEIEVQPFFEQVASAACQELFARYGVTVRRASDSDQPVSPDFLVCSVIGFTGRDIRGTLVLALTEGLSGLSNPAPASAGADASPRGDLASQRDWVGELSNQLLGRIKIELLKRGVEIYLNLPAVLLGQHLAPLPRGQLNPLKFTLANGAAAVWIDLDARPGFKIAAAEATDAGPGAGDALLFD